MGTLTRKTDPHQKCASSKPPAMGPMAIPSPMMPPQAPMAFARCLGSRKTSLTMDSDDGIVRAAPTPIMARDGDQEMYRAREGGADRPRPEDSQAEEEELLAPEAVRQAATDEQEPGEDHGIGVDDPLQLAGGGVQLPAPGWAEPR